MYKRLISLPKNGSFFLFGQRGTGKTSLLKTLYKDSALFINLLDSKQYLNLVSAPWRVRELIKSRTAEQEIIIIDEIQKIPALLDEVHLLIEEEKLCFALTGSSARKLKKAGVNLLAGRAFNYKLFPFTHQELGDDFNLSRALQWGGLPSAITAPDDRTRAEYLYSYVENYLREEIIQEQTVRQIEPFNRFLEIAAQSNGEVVNYESIAKDVKISAVSIKSYFQILEDTLIGFMLPSFHQSVRKRQKQSPKFYFYDTGLVRALRHHLEQAPLPETFEYGALFESFIINEIVRLNEYTRSRFQLSHLRVEGKDEIDLVIERPSGGPILVEIKSRDSISDREVASLNKLAPYFKGATSICLSRDTIAKTIGATTCLYWKEGIEKIFGMDRGLHIE